MKHGGYVKHRRTYQCWQGMKHRCYNKNSQQFKNYGGRGIKVCESWLQSFENFFADMGEKPEGLSLDRINNDGNYEPGNCRWATAKQQRLNQRTCVYLEHNGKRLTVEEWGRELGRHPTTIRSRLKQGWLLSDVLSPEKQLRGRCSKPRAYSAMKEQSNG